MGGTFTAAGGSGNPTAGFQKVHLADGDFQVQSPSNVPESQRFQYRNGVRTFWVHRNDKPINTATHTNNIVTVYETVSNNQRKRALRELGQVYQVTAAQPWADTPITFDQKDGPKSRPTQRPPH